MVASNTISTADGSAVVKLGSTTITCGIKLEVGVPLATAPKDGRIEVSVGMTPLCSPSFKVGRASDESISMGEALNDLITSTKVFDLSQLCIEEGKSSWVVYIDVYVLDYDGNVFDASLIGIVAALRSLRLPQTHVEEDGEVVITEVKPYKEPLKTRQCLFPLTCAFIGEHMIVDPSAKEEGVIDSTVSVVYNEEGKLCTVYKPGGAAATPDQLRTCMSLAKGRVETVYKLIQAAESASS